MDSGRNEKSDLNTSNFNSVDNYTVMMPKPSFSIQYTEYSTCSVFLHKLLLVAFILQIVLHIFNTRIFVLGDSDPRHLQGDGAEGPGSRGGRPDRLHPLQEHVHERHQQLEGTNLEPLN